MRLGWIEWLRLIAILMVIELHVLARPLQGYPATDSTLWLVANIVDSFSRVCVPLFFLISGYLTLGRYTNWQEFYKKRLVGIVLPFAFWWLCYFLLEGNIDKYHYWYMWAILPIFLAVPVINKIKDWPYLWLIVILGLLWSPSSYVCYFIVGYFASKMAIAGKLKIFLLVVYLATSLTTAFLTYQWAQKLGYFDEKFYHYYSPLVVVAGISLFLFMKDRNLNIGGIFARLSKHSFSIYLSHLLFLERSYTFGIVLQFAFTVAGALALSMVVDRLIGWIQIKILH